MAMHEPDFVTEWMSDVALAGLASSPGSAGAPSRQPEHAGGGEPHHILVVDDDPTIRDVLDQILAEYGYIPLLAGNGRVGVEIARGKQPSLILMDLMMPVMDGTTAIKLLKEDPATSWMRIIAMSAGVNLRNYAEELSADSLLGKPFDIDVLIADVTLHLQHVQRPRGEV